MANQNSQVKMFGKEKSDYGGRLLNTRKGRSCPRPVAVKNSMHLVLRSSKAVEQWSFKKKGNEAKVVHLIKKFSKKYGVKIHSFANVGNHLHFHLKLSSRYTYAPFIRALTASIAMAVTGMSRWNKLNSRELSNKFKFWDYRPFSRIIETFREFLSLSYYIRINELEGIGCSRVEAKMILINLESG